MSLRTQEGGDAAQPSLATSLRVVSAAVAAAAAATGLGQGRRAARHAAPIRTHLRRGRTARKTPGRRRRRTPGSRRAPLRNAPLVTHCSRSLISDCGRRRRAARRPRRRHRTNNEAGRKGRLKDASNGREARASTPPYYEYDRRGWGRHARSRS